MRELSKCLIAILLAPPAAGCGPAGSAKNAPGRTDVRLELTKRAEFTLEDPNVPVQYLEQLTILPDGDFIAVDIVSNKVRRFDSEGRLLGYVGPPSADEDDWMPRTSGLGSDPGILWVSDKLGHLWRYAELGLGSAVEHSVNRRLPHFVIGPGDGILGRLPSDDGELHLFKNGALERSFLQSDRFNLSLTAQSAPSVTFDGRGRIYAIRFLEPTVFVFNPKGEEIRRWPLRRDPNFREFPLGINPYSSTRDRDLILAWHRTFTTFPRIEWLTGDRIAVLSANDPPQRPNVISLYKPTGELIAAAEAEGYLVAAGGSDLYLANGFYFYDGPCRITRYSIGR